MTLKLTLARMLHPIERRIDALKNRTGSPVTIESYDGYPTPSGITLRGRILSVRPERQHAQRETRWGNAKAFFARFATDEQAGVEVSTLDGVAKTFSDDEGYFILNVPSDPESRLHNIVVRAADTSCDFRVFHTERNYSFGVVSDIDDTMMKTGAYSLMLNLWTTITGSVASRHIFRGSKHLMQSFEDRGAAIYYVSSSPWNLHRFLNDVFARNGLPLGPMFLRDFGLSETQFITGTHGDHKGKAIETVMDAAPDLKFYLVGDTGQHDAEIYWDMAKRYPARVLGILLRQATDTVPASAEKAITEARQAGINITVTSEFEPVNVPGNPAAPR